MKISKIEANYHTLRDECRPNYRRRIFEQLLSEHSLALIDLAIAHACDNKNEIMRQAEKLTELHLEWQSKITKPTDTNKWHYTAKKAVRMFPYSIMKLMGVAFPGKGELVYTPNQVRDMVCDVSVGVNIGSDFHAGWGNMSSKCKENLNNQWTWYGKMSVKMIVGLKRNGVRSNEFFKAAANSMEVAISIGKTLDNV